MCVGLGRIVDVDSRDRGAGQLRDHIERAMSHQMPAGIEMLGRCFAPVPREKGCSPPAHARQVHPRSVRDLRATAILHNPRAYMRIVVVLGSVAEEDMAQSDRSPTSRHRQRHAAARRAISPRPTHAPRSWQVHVRRSHRSDEPTTMQGRARWQGWPHDASRVRAVRSIHSPAPRALTRTPVTGTCSCSSSPPRAAADVRAPSPPRSLRRGTDHPRSRSQPARCSRSSRWRTGTRQDASREPWRSSAFRTGGAAGLQIGTGQADLDVRGCIRDSPEGEIQGRSPGNLSAHGGPPCANAG